MASPWLEILELLGDRLDADLLPGLYAAISLSTIEIRAAFQKEGLYYTDLDAGLRPSALELEESARQLIRQSRNQGITLAALSGLAGAAAIPPEILSSLVQQLRLAQRLCVLYGLDPETDAGKLVLWRALAAAYELELPTQGQVGVKLRDLPALLRSQVPATRQASTWLVRQLVQRTAAGVLSRATRVVPGLGAGVAAWSARRRIQAAGERMMVVYQRASEGLRFDFSDEVLAVELPE